MSVLGDRYHGKLEDLHHAMDRLVSLLREVEGRIEDKVLVRARLTDYRIKSLESIERKALKRQWRDEEALAECPDLIGARVMCNNVEDVYRFSELLRERLPWDSTFATQDYIKAPNERGYRALHTNFMLDAGYGLPPDRVACEVQIRTRLQDCLERTDT